MQNIYRQIRRIIYVAYIGMLSKPEKEFVPRKANLNNASYESKRVIYKARPINRINDVI